jgi:tetratricopeptide (TPR) repeat protein
MLINILLIVIICVTLGYSFFVIQHTLPRLANVNTKTMPEAKQAGIKRQILEDKLRRDFQKRWNVLKRLFIVQNKNKVTAFFGSIYQRLRDMEQEYRLASKKDLSAQVSTSQRIDESLATARQAIIEEQYSKAEQVLIDALQSDEHNVKAYTLLAQVYKAQGDYDHAKETLEYILHLTNAKDPGIYSSLADLALERGDLHTAQEDYLKSISLDPNNHNFYIELAEVYTMLAAHDKAQDAAQKAQALAPNNPKILDFLIENSIILQDKRRAADYLQRLVDANPENGKIASFRERIDSLS